ncbi:MAG: TolC family protein [Rickettsiales bacterium]|nr:TolC family protein [Rickettsiales bacterium]
MVKYVIMAMLVSTSLAHTAQAAESRLQEEASTFKQLEQKLRQHPEIAAYASRAESSSHYAKGELGLPDPMLFIQEQDYQIGSGTSRNQEEKMIGFRQVIPAFGTRGAKSERVGAESHKNKLLGDYAFATMKAQMITAFANLERIKAQEKLLDQQTSLFGSERTSLKGRISANLVGTSQLSLSQADSTDIELMRADLEEEKRENMAMLINMLGETPDVKLPKIEMVEWKDDAEKAYPVAIAAQDSTIAHKDVDLREAEFGPNFEVQTSYGRWNNGDNAGTVMVGVTIPLWASESQKPRLSGAKAAVNAAEFDKENIKRQTIEKLDHLQVQVKASAHKIELLKRKESLLGASKDAQTREYEAGKADFGMPLKTRRDMLSVRYQLAGERARHTALVADFNRYIIQGESK